MTNNLVGLFDDRETAQGAVNDLIAAGFARDRISIVTNDGSNGTPTTVDADGNLAGEGAASGLSSGAVVGGIAGLLIGAGFTVLPVAGFLLAGPIAGLLTGAVAGAATGGVLGGLIGLGIPKEHAELYAEGIRRGGTVVAVQADESMESQARAILNRDGAVDIERRSADWREQGYSGYDADAKPYTDAQIASDRARYASTVNNDWNDNSNAPAPSADSTYTGSNYTSGSGASASSSATTGVGTSSDYAEGSIYGTSATTTPSSGYTDPISNNGMSDEDDYRNHFGRTYPTGDYNRHASAYAYGRDLANDPTYGSGDWSTNESHFRSRWEERNPTSGWDEFKDSVRHAYDRAKATVTGHSNNATMR